MRAAYDTTCDFIYGLNSPYGPPNTRYAIGIPCRVVPQNEIVQMDFPMSLCSNWLTHDGPVYPNSPKYHSDAVGLWDADIETADRIAVPSLSLARWACLRREDISPFGRTPYSRSLLLPLSSIVSPPWLPPMPPPPPPPCPCVIPGLTCSAAGTVQIGVLYPWSLQPSTQQWWVWPSTASWSATYRCTVTADPSGNPFFILYQGSCSGLTVVASGSAISHFGIHAPGTALYLNVQPVATAATAYNFIVQSP